MAELTVADNGPGIAEEIRGRIFDPLFTTKAAGEGTGIGLAFCQRAVSAHSGTITAEAAAIGARLVVRLPLSRASRNEEGEAVPTAHSAIQGRILVVDDEPEVAQFIREVLVKDGFAVDSAASAEEALSLARSHSYMIVLSDLNMPGMAGRGLYDVISREMPNLAMRVAFVTGDTMSVQARAFLDSAGRPYLEKPVAPAELRELVNSMISARSRQAAGA
jgi:CheY-like chemotaxis protein